MLVLRESRRCVVVYNIGDRWQCGRYYYKYIINGDWRHSTTSPTERDDRGNTNNIIVVGDVANVRPTIQQPRKVKYLHYELVVFLIQRRNTSIALKRFFFFFFSKLQDANIIKVIERVLTESERFRLAKAARCIAFSVCPIRLCPK